MLDKHHSAESLAAALRGHRSCALLDYPDHLNVGDHLIWLSTISVLLRNQITPSYCASLLNFSSDEMERHAGSAPILLQGGGNLGDLWPECQLFREKIVSQYHDRPVVILPQSIYFSDPENMRRASTIFNAHPDLTIFAREKRSFDIASDLFPNCRVLQAPDMALWSDATFIPQRRTNAGADLPVLFLCRRDDELNQDFTPERLNVDTEVQDWCTYSWAYDGRGKVRSFDEWYWRLPGAVRCYREWWQRGLSQPAGFLSRLGWEKSGSLARQVGQLHGASMHRFSWSLMHDAVRQISRCRFLITNRLHGQVVASLLGIPSILVPNSYHKNESFFETWMEERPNCRFAATPEQLRAAIGELSSLRN